MKNIRDKKNYCPIKCLNTLYEILTGLVAKDMREHTAVNEIWDEGQLGAVEGVLGTVDQHIIDRGAQATSSQPGSSLLRL